MGARAPASVQWCAFVCVCIASPCGRLEQARQYPFKVTRARKDVQLHRAAAIICLGLDPEELVPTPPKGLAARQVGCKILWGRPKPLLSGQRSQHRTQGAGINVMRGGLLSFDSVRAYCSRPGHRFIPLRERETGLRTRGLPLMEAAMPSFAPNNCAGHACPGHAVRWQRIESVVGRRICAVQCANSGAGAAWQLQATACWKEAVLLAASGIPAAGGSFSALL